MLTVDDGAEVCPSVGQRTCCNGAAERRLQQVAVQEAHDVVASETSSLQTLVADNAALYERMSRCYL